MPLTIRTTYNGLPEDRWGKAGVDIKDVTIGVYSTGGLAVDPGQFGLKEIMGLIECGRNAAAGGYLFVYNTATKKLQVFEEEAVAAGGALVETANLTNLSALVVRFLAIGF